MTGAHLLCACFCLYVNAYSQKYELIEKIDLPISYPERFKFSVDKLIDSTYYVFKTDVMSYTQLMQTANDTLFCHNLGDKRTRKIACKWPKAWIGNKSVITDFYVYKDMLYIGFNTYIHMFRINWKKGSVRPTGKIYLGYFENIHHVSGSDLYYSTTYDYDNSIVYPGPHIGKLNLETKKTSIQILSRKGIQFSHFPSKRVDFKHGQFVTTDILDFNIHIYDGDLRRLDSVNLDELGSNSIGDVYYDYTKAGLATIKEQDKNLARIIKVYRSGVNDMHIVYKDTACRTRNQYKLCVLSRVDSTWKIRFRSGIINENEAFASPDFIPWLNSGAMYHIVDNRLFLVGSKNISVTNGLLDEKKNFCIYVYNMLY